MLVLLLGPVRTAIRGLGEIEKVSVTAGAFFLCLGHTVTRRWFPIKPHPSLKQKKARKPENIFGLPKMTNILSIHGLDIRGTK